MIKKNKKPSKRSSFKGFSGGAAGIRTLVPVKANGFQDHLVMTASIQLRVIKLCFPLSNWMAQRKEKQERTSLFCEYRRTVKPLVLGHLGEMKRTVCYTISRPPRYDHFDTSPSHVAC